MIPMKVRQRAVAVAGEGKWTQEPGVAAHQRNQNPKLKLGLSLLVQGRRLFFWFAWIVAFLLFTCFLGTRDVPMINLSQRSVGFINESRP